MAHSVEISRRKRRRKKMGEIMQKETSDPTLSPEKVSFLSIMQQ